jgi:hypothetical protein
MLERCHDSDDPFGPVAGFRRLKQTAFEFHYVYMIKGM